MDLWASTYMCIFIVLLSVVITLDIEEYGGLRRWWWIPVDGTNQTKPEPMMEITSFEVEDPPTTYALA